MATPSQEQRSLLHDPLRPGYHFLPETNWMNDPNGFVRWGDTYHLFYQYNPNGSFWGTIHWGHASSSDLIHWEHHPLALRPGPAAYDVDGCWSGCVVDDAGTPTLLYTGKEGDFERVCLARGDADLLTWQKDENNPLVALPPAGLHTRGFRDPFVWREEDVWHMLMGSGIHGKGGAVLLYTSHNLLQWEYQRPFFVGDELTGTMWECPGFFRLGQDRAILVVSVIPLDRVIAFVGRYAQGVFSPEQQVLLDAGYTVYAPQFIRNDDNSLVMMAWLKEELARETFWAGAMSLPRVISFSDNGKLRMKPLPALAQLRAAAHKSTLHLREGETTSLTINRLGQWEWECRIPADAQGLLTFSLGDEEQDYVLIALDLTRQLCRMQSQNQTQEAWLSYHKSADEPTCVQCFFDHSIFEIFIQQEQCVSKRVYPVSVESVQLKLGLQGVPAFTLHMDVWDLHEERSQLRY